MTYSTLGHSPGPSPDHSSIVMSGNPSAMPTLGGNNFQVIPWTYSQARGGGAQMLPLVTAQKR